MAEKEVVCGKPPVRRIGRMGDPEKERRKVQLMRKRLGMYIIIAGLIHAYSADKRAKEPFRHIALHYPFAFTILRSVPYFGMAWLCRFSHLTCIAGLASKMGKSKQETTIFHKNLQLAFIFRGTAELFFDLTPKTNRLQTSLIFLAAELAAAASSTVSCLAFSRDIARLQSSSIRFAALLAQVPSIVLLGNVIQALPSVLKVELRAAVAVTGLSLCLVLSEVIAVCMTTYLAFRRLQSCKSTKSSQWLGAIGAVILQIAAVGRIGLLIHHPLEDIPRTAGFPGMLLPGGIAMTSRLSEALTFVGAFVLAHCGNVMTVLDEVSVSDADKNPDGVIREDNHHANVGDHRRRCTCSSSLNAHDDVNNSNQCGSY